MDIKWIAIIAILIAAPTIIKVIFGTKNRKETYVPKPSGKNSFPSALSKPRPQYKAKTVLTPSEQVLYWSLRKALPDYVVLAQVAFSALMEPNIRNGKYFWQLFGRISQKRADFTVCDKAFRIVAIIELDDNSHDSAKDQERDAVTESAGIRTIRWNVNKMPTEEEILTAIVDIPSAPLSLTAKQGVTVKV